MKKRILALTSIVCILLSLCSCGALDRMKASHAHFKSDVQQTGDFDTIYLDGHEFHKTNLSLNLQKYHSKLEQVGYVTTADVPVLLYEMYGSYIRFNKNKTVLQRGGDQYTYFRSDVKAELEKVLANEFTDYCYFDLTKNEDVLVSKQIADAIADTVKGKPVASTDYSGSRSISLERCDKYMAFSDMIVDIYLSENDCFLQTYSYSNYENISTYVIPKQYKQLFDDLHKEITKNAGVYEILTTEEPVI